VIAKEPYFDCRKQVLEISNLIAELFLYCPCCPIVKLLSESNNTLSAPKGDIFTYIILKTHIVLKV
jgi:hypothetical protein